METGTIEIVGTQATNIDHTVTIKPASLYGVLVEAMGVFGCCMADLPFQLDDQAHKHAMLWSTDLSGT